MARLMAETKETVRKNSFLCGGINRWEKQHSSFQDRAHRKPGWEKIFMRNMILQKRVFDSASKWLDLDMKALCFEENDKLDLTEYTQALLVTTCLAMEKGRRGDGTSSGCNCRLKPW